jgi:hypothetical protein
MDLSRRNKAKLLAAVMGGSAVVTMGALTMTTHQQPSGTANLAVGKMTLAATTTADGKIDVAKDDTVEATSMAVPSIKGPAPLPSEDQGVPG